MADEYTLTRYDKALLAGVEWAVKRQEASELAEAGDNALLAPLTRVERRVYDYLVQYGRATIGELVWAIGYRPLGYDTDQRLVAKVISLIRGKGYNVRRKGGYCYSPPHYDKTAIVACHRCAAPCERGVFCTRSCAIRFHHERQVAA